MHNIIILEHHNDLTVLPFDTLEQVITVGIIYWLW